MQDTVEHIRGLVTAGDVNGLQAYVASHQDRIEALKKDASILFQLAFLLDPAAIIVPMAIALLDLGADPNTEIGYDKSRLLHLISRNPKLTSLLPRAIITGANIEAVNVDGLTPLLEAVEAKNLIAVMFLVDLLANVNYQNPATGSTALHIVLSKMQEGGLELYWAYAQKLIANGARLDIANNNGVTAQALFDALPAPYQNLILSPLPALPAAESRPVQEALGRIRSSPSSDHKNNEGYAA